MSIPRDAAPIWGLALRRWNKVFEKVSLLKKDSGTARNLIKKEFSEIFKKTVFTEHLRMTTSEFWNWYLFISFMYLDDNITWKK